MSLLSCTGSNVIPNEAASIWAPPSADNVLNSTAYFSVNSGAVPIVTPPRLDQLTPLAPGHWLT